MSAIQTHTLDRDKARHTLLDLISNGKVEQDSPLSERSLSEKLKLGRTPVREAIRDLVRDGILHVVPGYGAVLRRFTIEDLREIYEIRQALEEMACELAAQHGSTAELDGYFEMYKGFKVETDVPPVEIQAHNLAFHHAIFAAANNKTLQEMYSNLRIRIQASMNMARHHQSYSVRQASSVEEHLLIIEAVQAKDPVAARQAMRTHLDSGYEARVRILAGLM